MHDDGRFETRYENSDGLPVRLEAASRVDEAGRSYTHHRLIVAEGRPGAVVLGVRGDEVLLVRSFRASVGREMWELPRGSGEEIDTGDSPMVAAGVRELHEETGYAAGSAVLLGEYVIDSSVFPQLVGVVRCEVDPDAEPGDGDGEVDEARWFSREHVLRMLRDGTIADAHSLSSIALWLADGAG